jgi:predicted RNA-binding Zn-ribbon protein involved in translation (DUF1610 family)
MIVRCGKCRTGFDVPGPGRHVCPSCGTVNEVRATQGLISTAPPPAPVQEHPSPRVSCATCGFSFIVGNVAVAPCPNCGTPVTVEATQEGEG